MSLTHKALPTVTGFQAVDFGLAGRSQTFESPLTGTTQTVALTGPRWRASYETPPLKDANARAWKAWIASLRGRAFAFYGHDPSFEGYAGLDALVVDAGAPTADSGIITADSGAVTADAWAGPATIGSPVVREAGQTGAVLKTAGWTPSIVLKAGEYIGFDYSDGQGNTLRALHMIETTITVAASGFCNLTLIPPVRIAPALDAPLYTTRPACSMRLADDAGGRWEVDAGGFHRLRFEALQVLVGEPAA